MITFLQARLAAAIFLGLFLFASPFQVLAQPCDPHWIADDSIPGVYGRVYALTTWDPDGPLGNMPRMIVAGGGLSLAGSAETSRIALFDTVHSRWSAAGTGVNATVNALTTLPNSLGGEDLIAGGSFTVAGGNSVSYLARWDGNNWSSIGGGVTGGTVRALVTIPRVSGGADLYVGGAFTAAGTTSTSYLAKWDGTAWSALGTGLNSAVNGLSTAPNTSGSRDLIVTGSFTRAGAFAANGVASWNGSSWSTYYQYPVSLLGGANAAVGLPNGTGGYRLHVSRTKNTVFNTIDETVAEWLPGYQTLGGRINGKVVALAAVAKPAGGHDLFASGYCGLLKWSGTAWQSTGCSGEVMAMTTIPNASGGEDLIIGGYFSGAGGVHVSNVARLSGTTWSALGSGLNTSIYSLARIRDAAGTFHLVAARALSLPGGAGVTHLTRQTASGWQSFGGGVNARVRTMLVVPQPSGADHLIIGGDFTLVGSLPVRYIARWDGTSWSTYGSGFDGGGVLSLAMLPNASGGQDLIAAGAFKNSGGAPINRIARWNGSAWQQMGQGLSFNDARLQPIVNSIVVIPRPTGGEDLYAGGFFDRSGSTVLKGVASWNGTSWDNVGGGVSGRMVSFPFSFDLFEWNPVNVIGALPTAVGRTDLIVAGLFTGAGGVPVRHIARWDGFSWSALGLGIGPAVNKGEYAFNLANLPNFSGGHDLLVGGTFGTAGGIPASRIARWDGAAWWPVDGGMNDDVNCLLPVPGSRNRWELYAGGQFFAAAGRAASCLALANCPTPSCKADIDGDGQIDFSDYLNFLSAFVEGNDFADFNEDSNVDFFDYLDFADSFSLGC